MAKTGEVREALLPCPFCGGRAKTKLPYVRCVQCGAQMSFGDDVNDEASAIPAWNRRTPSAEVERLQARLGEAEADRDSWRDQASDRLKEWDAMRQRAEAAEAAGRLIVEGAMPATHSGQTCFVPRYQIDKLRDAITGRKE